MAALDPSTQLLKIKDIMKIFCISRRTVYHWMDKGILKPLRIGGVCRFRKEDIERMLQDQAGDMTEGKKRLSVLAIDDDVLVRESLKNILKREHIQANVVASGYEALEAIKRENFDLIITDIRMPGMNGIETIQAIRSLRKNLGRRPIPEIILTAYDDAPVQEDAKRLGVRNFILKPFELNEFISTLRSQLN
ncbi:MAG: response regulator [Candidatus Omnitrophota bacterium]